MTPRCLFALALALTLAGVVGCASTDDPQTLPEAPDAAVDAQAEDAPVATEAEASADVASESDAGVDGGAEALADSGLDTAAQNKAANCASEFGDQLTVDFGRIDGTVHAVVGTSDTQCTLYNDDHLVIQVLMGGKVYRMVVNLQSSYGDPNVGMLAVGAPLTGPSWSEGWHTGVALDYVNTLGVHTSDFTAHPMLELEALVTSEIDLGAKISVFATNSSTQYASSAHLIHRNETNKDGAIVIGPDAPNPRYLLFRFADQSF